jgi:ABC-type sugar transport system ATPase subunit
MNTGSIEQVGTPEEIYNYPHSLFVAKFLNLGIDTPAINLLDGKLFLKNFKVYLLGFVRKI